MRIDNHQTSSSSTDRWKSLPLRLVSLTVFPAWQLSPSLPGRTTCGGVAATATRCGHLSGVRERERRSNAGLGMRSCWRKDFRRWELTVLMVKKDPWLIYCTVWILTRWVKIVNGRTEFMSSPLVYKLHEEDLNQIWRWVIKKWCRCKHCSIWVLSENFSKKI